MRQMTFEAVCETPSKKLFGIILEAPRKGSEKKDRLIIHTSEDWMRYFELLLSSRGVTVEAPAPLAFSLGSVLQQLDVEIDHAELRLERYQSQQWISCDLLLKKRNSEEVVSVEARATEAVMLCHRTNRPIMVDRELIWESSPRSFFDSVTPSDFARAYQERFVEE